MKRRLFGARYEPIQLFGLLLCFPLCAYSASPLWGRLANPGFVTQRIKATYFFSGQALDGSNWYQANPAPGCDTANCSNPTYTLHPADTNQLRWSESLANRYAALDSMVQAGINVIHMSSWGDDVANAWVTGSAPMQTSPASHDELFDAAAARPLLIIPFLEERGGTNSPWAFKDEFPTTPDGRVAPGTIAQIDFLIRHYLQDPAHPERSNRWARVYDSNGGERFAIGIIHAASNRLASNDNVAFALGFDAVAAQVLRDTSINIGFLIDALPTNSAQATFCPDSHTAGPALTNRQSMLGIAAFVPEVYLGSNNTVGVLNWKRNWAQGWFESGVPFLMDISSGYDGRLVFHTTWYYGLDQPFVWLCGLDQMVRDFGQASGVVFNSWNGYTEGMVALPTVENRTLFYDWFRFLLAVDVYARKPDAPAPRNGTWCAPYTLAEAVQNVPVKGTIGLLPNTTTPFTAPITISKACTVRSLGGIATIGP